MKNLVNHQVIKDCAAGTTFIADHPEVLKVAFSRNRANRLLKFIAEVSVNGHSLMPDLHRPSVVEGGVEREDAGCSDEPVTGWRDLLVSKGKSAFLKQVAASKELLFTDTTLRDAQQSLLATRMRTVDMLPHVQLGRQNLAGAFSLEVWGGATFDTSLRFLYECPWGRLAALRELVPNIPLQMLLPR